ncbi:MAG: apolipoprotein N-acyltransferase [Methylotenera sp.]|nr:apolipoprotein N-acyltransferase [Methylotenera sp.]MDD4926670.1 apolipoprotein N-acyltransferase [Methylotenera sp.]
MSLFTMHKLLKLLALLLLGAFCVLGFSPFYFYPASIVSLIGLCYFWHLADSPKQAALDGFVYGLGLFGAGIYWIYISLHTFGGMPSVMAGFSTFVLASFMALFPAAVGALSKRISNNNHDLMIIAIPAFWALSDWIRSWIFTGFPWLTIGYSQVPYSPLAGYMPITGVYGVTLISVFIASLLAFWLAKKPVPMNSRRNGIAALILIIVSGQLLKLVEWTTPNGDPLSVSLLQGNIAQDMKWDPEIANQTLNQYLTMAESSTAKLIVMPETALPVLSSELPAEIGTRLQQHAIKNKGDILLGLVERENREYFNSVFSIGSSKSAVYRKSHLVPFGEFIPFKIAFGWIYRDLLNMPLSDLSRGNKYQQPMPIAGEKVAVNICYEDVFGEEVIRQLPAATLLVNVSNDAWYGTSYAADQHMQFSQARALETGRMMLRATNTGATAIINHKGYVIAHASHFIQTSLNGTAQGYAGSTPYVRWGNWPLVIFCFSVIAFIWRRNTMKRPKSSS